MYNGDANYKYLIPAREGYTDHLNDKYISPGVAPYLYAAQGNRDLMRNYWVSNRMKFIRGGYTSNKFRQGDRVEFRWYYPSATVNEGASDSDRRLAISA